MLIVNPAAGRGGYKVNFAEALHTLDLGGYRTTLFFTSGRGKRRSLPRAMLRTLIRSPASVGDGTLSEVLAGLMQLDSPPLSGICPWARRTTSHDARPAEERHGWRGAQDSPRRGAPRFDVGGFGDDKYFAYIAAFGAFTEVSYATPAGSEKAAGSPGLCAPGRAAAR